jgi:nucleotide-binding universal stress UspA family protein
MKDIEITKILVPTDFSSSAAAALDYAAALARRLGAEIHLFHAYHFPTYLIMPEQIATPGDFWESLRSSAAARLEAMRAPLVAAGIDTHLHVMEGAPASAILEAARSLPADLIVMGTRGRTGLKHVALGSVAERTVRMAPCPVLTLKTED